jgi:ethanolamine utilization microcompartment shell protein EutS
MRLYQIKTNQNRGTMNNRTKSLRLGLVPGLFLAFAALATFAAQAKAQSLGTAERFAVLGGSTVTNTGASIISGDVGVSPGSAITGFPPGIIINGALHANDAIAMQAHADLATAYTAFAGLPSPPANNLTGVDLGGLTLTPGVYRCDVAATWSSGTLTFDAQNVPTARFVIQIGTTLITPSSSSVVLINGADARNVYFQVGTSATLGSGSNFIGNILANAAITAVGGTNLTGRLLAVVEAVTLDTNNVTNPGPGGGTPTPTPTPGGTPTPTPTPSPAQLLNISTRSIVQTGDNVSIGGFIIRGSAPKYVIVRAIGPSLTRYGVPDALADPVLELHGPGGFVTIINDNWRDTQQTVIEATGLPPTNDLESAIVATLAPGAYTAIVRGKNNTSGVALVEVYDLAPSAGSKLANISTRAFVDTADNIVIAGFILGNGGGDDRIIVRGIGPSLTAAGVPNVLANPILELRNSDGTLLVSDNDWQDNPAQAAEITAAGLAPTNNLESAIAATLPPGPYTALLAGLNNGTGVGLVEVYDRGAP